MVAKLIDSWSRGQCLAAAAMLLFAVSVAGPALGAGAAAPPESDPLVRFVERFKTAFLTRDQRLAQELFFWEGLNPIDREHISALIDDDLDRRLIGVRVYLANREGLENRRRDLNLEVVAQLLARFVDDSGRVHHSLHQLGVSNGDYFIVLPRSIRPDAVLI